MMDSGQALRVLVVDDNKDAADSLGKLVQLWGHEVRTAYDASALDLVGTFQPDAVLLDIGMPRMDGNCMARRMREQGPSSNMLIVAVTGYHDEANRMLSKDAGVDHYLIKPVDLSVLEKLLVMKLMDKERCGGSDHAGRV
jgi:DNA-binding response OmpR family regulator